MTERLLPRDEDLDEPVWGCLTADECDSLMDVRDCVEYTEQLIMDRANDELLSARLDFQVWRREHGKFDDDMGGEE